MASIKGPAIFLAQFMRDEAPYNSLENIGKWVADLGYKGVQIPSWDGRCFDLEKAAASKAYCDDFRAILDKIGLEPTEIAAHLQGQVLAIHPAYEEGCCGSAGRMWISRRSTSPPPTPRSCATCRGRRRSGRCLRG